MTRKGIVLATATLLIMAGNVFGQVKKPSNISASMYSLLASENYQPLWLTANKGGLFEEFSSSNGLLRLKGSVALDRDKTFDYAYGFDLSALWASSTADGFINEAYLSGKAYIFQVDVGRKYRTVGENPAGLSSGSMVLGTNTMPIPMINISIPEFVPVPFTYEFIQFRGNLAHGWLENDRYVENAYLHEKTFYLQGGFDHWPLQGYAGMVHFVQWGGDSTNPNVGKLPSGFDDFISVFFGKGGGETAPGGEQINALGNHLGIWDFGIKAESKSYTYQVYWQHFFEDYSGLMFRNIGDGLWGATIQRKENRVISGLLWEVLYTKDQSGPGLTDRPGDFSFCEEENCGYKYGGRDNYYNNFIYRNGWTYQGRNLGNPLLMNVAQFSSYQPNAQTFNPAIESNRILAHHVGLEGYISDALRYKAYITYVRHYGNYRGLNRGQRFGSENPTNDLTEYEFYPALEQWNLMLETAYSFKSLPQLDVTTALAYDTGDLTSNTGILLGATWNF